VEQGVAASDQGVCSACVRVWALYFWGVSGARNKNTPPWPEPGGVIEIRLRPCRIVSGGAVGDRTSAAAYRGQGLKEIALAFPSLRETQLGCASFLHLIEVHLLCCGTRLTFAPVSAGSHPPQPSPPRGTTSYIPIRSDGESSRVSGLRYCGLR